MERICRLSDWVNRCVQYVGFVQLSLMTLIIILQVFYRYVLGSSLSWSEESARFLFIWIVLLGASMGVKEGFHVAVTLFKDWLPRRIKAGVDILFTLLTGVMAAVMVVYGWSIADTVSIQQSPAVRISMFWVYLAIPVSGALMLVHLAARLVELSLAFNAAGKGDC